MRIFSMYYMGAMEQKTHIVSGDNKPFYIGTSESDAMKAFQMALEEAAIGVVVTWIEGDVRAWETIQEPTHHSVDEHWRDPEENAKAGCLWC